MKLNLQKKSKMCGECVIGLVFALLEISIVIGETLGWIIYNSGLDSILFIIFLVVIVSYHKKKQNKEIREGIL
ncbi:MAG: hypothetical protein ACFE8N_09355 [Promethearchaeota archaeon]